MPEQHEKTIVSASIISQTLFIVIFVCTFLSSYKFKAIDQVYKEIVKDDIG